MDPFVWNKETVLRSRNRNSAINILIRNSNTTIYGLNTMEITQIKYVNTNIIDGEFRELWTLYFDSIVITFQRIWTRSEKNEIWAEIICTVSYNGVQL